MFLVGVVMHTRATRQCYQSSLFLCGMNAGEKSYWKAILGLIALFQLLKYIPVVISSSMQWPTILRER